jgi:hypothetical protein
VSKRAKLRVCASCEWIFKLDGPDYQGCPKCQFGHYSARHVYGDNAYRYAKTQKPWYDKKMANYAVKLSLEIKEAQTKQKPKFIFPNIFKVKT